MWMEPSDIVKSYKSARSRNKQIKILAQLNATTTGEIEKILKEAGYDVKYTQSHNKEVHKICMMCGKEFDGHASRKYCDECGENFIWNTETSKARRRENRL